MRCVNLQGTIYTSRLFFIIKRIFAKIVIFFVKRHSCFSFKRISLQATIKMSYVITLFE